MSGELTGGDLGKELAAYRAGYADGLEGVRIDRELYFGEVTADHYIRGLFDARAGVFDEQLRREDRGEADPS